MRRWIVDHSLTLFFTTIFLASLVGQSIAGHHTFNAEQQEHGSAAVSYGDYVFSSDFWAKVMENWQSEFLQFSLLILATVWLFQKGSTESKEQAGVESPQKMRIRGYAPENAPAWAKAGGLKLKIYENSLLIAMTVIFFAAWGSQSVTNWRQFNEDQREHDEPTITWARYLTYPDFWDKTLQNWQSEFLAVGTMAIFSVYLRQHSSAESKPVGAPHDETGSSG